MWTAKGDRAHSRVAHRKRGISSPCPPFLAGGMRFREAAWSRLPRAQIQASRPLTREVPPFPASGLPLSSSPPPLGAAAQGPCSVLEPFGAFEDWTSVQGFLLPRWPQTPGPGPFSHREVWMGSACCHPPTPLPRAECRRRADGPQEARPGEEVGAGISEAPSACQGPPGLVFTT